MLSAIPVAVAGLGNTVAMIASGDVRFLLILCNGMQNCQEERSVVTLWVCSSIHVRFRSAERFRAGDLILLAK